jgi:gluconate 5-dehydrogenase
MTSTGWLDPNALRGRTALVTGASAGIGLACATALDGAGATVVLVARGERGLTDACAAMSRRARSLVADLAAEDGVTGLVDRVAADVGHVDVLVNNVGGGEMMPADRITDRMLQEQFQLNVFAPLILAGKLGARMAERGAGSIINISSKTAVLGVAELSVYCAAKSAVNGFTRALAAEWGEHGVRVNAVMPGLVATESNRNLTESPTILAGFNDRCDLRRPASPEEVAAVVAFLASDGSTYLTGQCIPVDGGVIGAHHGYPRFADG